MGTHIKITYMESFGQVERATRVVKALIEGPKFDNWKLSHSITSVLGSPSFLVMLAQACIYLLKSLEILLLVESTNS